MSEMTEGKQRKGSALKAMVSFFTVIRTPIEQEDMDAMEKRFWLVPLVGLLVGLVAFGVCVLASYCGLGVMVQAVFALATAYLFSKFIHLDGLIDFGDGMICSSADREKHVRALKDTLVGAGGVGVGIIVVLMIVIMYLDAGIRVAPYLHEHVAIASLALVCEVLSKNSQVTAAAIGKPGNGMAARQVSMTTPASAAKAAVLSLIIVMAVIVANIYAMGMTVTSADPIYYMAGVVALLASMLAGIIVARTANKAFGFVNGDILGA